MYPFQALGPLSDLGSLESKPPRVVGRNAEGGDDGYDLRASPNRRRAFSRLWHPRPGDLAVEPLIPRAFDGSGGGAGAGGGGCTRYHA